MRPQHRYDDDDSPFDRFGVLKDGHTATVSMMMRDSSQRDARVTDAGLHRPGFRLGDTYMRDARQRLYDQYDLEKSREWQDAGSVTGQRAGDLCTVRHGGGRYGAEGSPGHLKMIGNELVCVADDRRSEDALPVRDERELAYRDYQSRIENAWRNP
jgi:hypothetical protein